MNAAPLLEIHGVRQAFPSLTAASCWSSTAWS